MLSGAEVIIRHGLNALSMSWEIKGGMMYVVDVK